MADNYLEKRFEEVFGAGARKKTTVKRTNPSIDTLLHRNRSYRGYDPSRIVTEAELRDVVAANTLVPSAMNQQSLRFRLVTRENGSDKILSNIKMGAALPDLHLPLPGTQPEAFIIVCSTKPENRYVDIDLGISLQSMLLKAVSMGLNGLIICAFDREAIVEAFSLQYPPLAILALGKGAESIYLMPIHEGEEQKYYRKEGVHYVPKLTVDDIII